MIFVLLTACSINKDWVKSEIAIEEGLHDIEVINDKIAISYSYGTGNVYKTTTGGKEWEKIYQFDSIYFEQIQFLDKETGWIVGSPNKIYKTENGGESWIDKSLKTESTGAYIYGMYFSTQQMGYIAALERGEQGFYTKIFKTEDGGDHWTLLNQVDEMILNIEDIKGTLYATGNSVIIKDIDREKNWTYLFQDTSKQVGQIRDMEVNETGEMLAVSFNGFIINIDKQNTHMIKISEK